MSYTQSLDRGCDNVVGVVGGVLVFLLCVACCVLGVAGDIGLQIEHVSALYRCV